MPFVHSATIRRLSLVLLPYAVLVTACTGDHLRPPIGPPQSDLGTIPIVDSGVDQGVDTPSVEAVDGGVDQGVDIPVVEWVDFGLEQGCELGGPGPSVPPVVLPPGPVPNVDLSLRAQWSFDEGTTGPVADGSGLGNVGIASNGVIRSGCEGRNMASFDGDDDVIQVKDVPLLDISGKITMAAWVRPTRVRVQSIINKAGLDATDGYELGLNQTGAVYVRFNQATQTTGLTLFSKTKPVYDGKTWTHIAATYDGSDIRIYVNGKLDAEAAAVFSIGVNDLPLSIGNTELLKSGYGGDLDDLSLYAVALTEDEIRDIAAASTGRGLISRWSFESQEGNQLPDTGSANNPIVGFTPQLTKKLISHGMRKGLWVNKDSVMVAHHESLNFDEMTMAAWIRPQQKESQRILAKGNVTTDGYELSLSSTGTVFARWNRNSAANAYRVISNSQYPHDGKTWMHIAASYDGKMMRLYINGKLEANKSANFTIGPNSKDLRIGADELGEAPFYGQLDDVQLYKGVVSPCEIEEMAKKTVLTELDGLGSSTGAGNTFSTNQSKTWFAFNHWWAVLPGPNGGTELYRQDGTKWTQTLHLTSTPGWADSLAFGSEVAILVHETKAAHASLHTLSYKYSTNNYEFKNFPAKINLEGGEPKVPTIARDSKGKIWVAWTANDLSGTGRCYVRHNELLAAQPSMVVVDGLTSSDLCKVVALGQTNQVGIVWSNMELQRYGFRFRNDDASSHMTWGAIELPAASGANANLILGQGVASPNLNIAVADDGRLYLAIETRYFNKSLAPVIGLLVRNADGTWSPFDNGRRVDLVGKSDGNNSPYERAPVVVIDKIHSTLVVAYTSQYGGGDILYRKSSLWPIAFGEEKTLISGAVPLSFAAATRDNTGAGMMFLASDADGNQPSGLIHSAHLGY